MGTLSYFPKLNISRTNWNGTDFSGTDFKWNGIFRKNVNIPAQPSYHAMADGGGRPRGGGHGTETLSSKWEETCSNVALAGSRKPKKRLEK